MKKKTTTHGRDSDPGVCVRACVRASILVAVTLVVVGYPPTRADALTGVHLFCHQAEENIKLPARPAHNTYLVPGSKNDPLLPLSSPNDGALHYPPQLTTKLS